jgi:hypothetical protein
MCGLDRAGIIWGVVITMRLDATDPPAGRVSRAGGPEVAFVGWLGLLRVLSELLASPRP